MIDKFDKFVVQDLGKYDNSNSNNNTKYFKFIGFFINNRSSHSKQFTTIIKIIKVDINNIKINNIVNTLFE